MYSVEVFNAFRKIALLFFYNHPGVVSTRKYKWRIYQIIQFKDLWYLKM